MHWEEVRLFKSSEPKRWFRNGEGDGQGRHGLSDFMEDAERASLEDARLKLLKTPGYLPTAHRAVHLRAASACHVLPI